jgi:L,D-peptidoglycan transpeptidase YkuD (ErfK/YbiS/YcfS/YnhG family)
MGRQYDYVAVIDFNRPDPVIGRGSGIFLHVKNGHATAGCVSIPHRAMRKVLRWLDPSKAPMIVMGQRDWLRAAR